MVRAKQRLGTEMPRQGVGKVGRRAVLRQPVSLREEQPGSSPESKRQGLVNVGQVLGRGRDLGSSPAAAHFLGEASGHGLEMGSWTKPHLAPPQHTGHSGRRGVWGAERSQHKDKIILKKTTWIS